MNEYKDLLPLVNDQNIVFSHNDIQEFNFLHNEAGITKILDFEYSQHNFLGIDLASYINESAIDYSSPSEFGYTINSNDFLSFDENGGVIDQIIE